MGSESASLFILPGWLFPPETLAPLRSACHTPARWVLLPWETALDGARLRASVAAAASSCWLAAWSMGALAALRLAANAPPNLAGLLLFGATARLPGDPATAYAGVAPPALAAMRKRLRRDPAGLFRDFHALCQLPNSPRADDADVFVARALTCDPERADAGLTLLATLDLRPSLASIRVPVFALHGEADAVVPVSQAHALAAAVPRGKVVTLAGRGHLPDAETFTIAADLLMSLLGSAPATPEAAQ